MNEGPRFRKILAIRFARLGDVILLLPALRAIKSCFPDAQITLITGHRCAPIAELCPSIDEVISVDRVAMRNAPIIRALRDMKEVVIGVRRRNFDLVIDFHSFRETNLLAWLSRASVRLGMKRHNQSFLRYCFTQPPVLEDKRLHAAEMFRRVASAVPGAELRSETSPTLRIPQGVRERVSATLPPKPRLALYVDAPAADRVWPADRFAAVADYAIERWNASVLVLSSPAGAALAARTRGASRHGSDVHAFTDLTLPELAGMVESAQVLISNDTGPMHLGPALGVCTLALFSVGFPEHFRPTGVNDKFLRANPIRDIGVERVIELLESSWATVGPDPPR